jgi:hypothetical protein
MSALFSVKEGSTGNLHFAVDTNVKKYVSISRNSHNWEMTETVQVTFCGR